MNQINSSNIGAYINFLHKKKTNTPASNEMIQSWSDISDAEISEHLGNLYNTWGINQVTLSQWNAEFFRAQPGPIVPPIDAPKRNPVLIYAIIGLLIIAIGFLAKLVFFNDKPNEDTSAKMNTEAPATSAPKNESPNITAPPAPEVKPQEPTTTVAPAATIPSKIGSSNQRNNSAHNEEINDDINIGKIRDLLIAESNQDLSTIKNCFASSGVRYWDMKNVTNTQVANKYRDTWSKAEDFSYDIHSADKISRNKYLVTGIYSYYSYKTGSKSVRFRNVYIFNDYNKIIAAYSN